MRKVGAAILLGLMVMPAAYGTDAATRRFLVEQNVYPAVEKLGRGLGNVLTGWVEIPLEMRRRYNPNSPTTASATMMTGLLWGLTGAVIRTGAGAYETATFFIPIPENFAPVLPPLERLECAPSSSKASCR